MEAAEDMFASPAELEGGSVVGGTAAAVRGLAGAQAGLDAVAPLPVDLVCNGVWRPVQQARFLLRSRGAFALVGVAVREREHLCSYRCVLLKCTLLFRRLSEAPGGVGIH